MPKNCHLLAAGLTMQIIFFKTKSKYYITQKLCIAVNGDALLAIWALCDVQIALSYVSEWGGRLRARQPIARHRWSRVLEKDLV